MTFDSSYHVQLHERSRPRSGRQTVCGTTPPLPARLGSWRAQPTFPSLPVVLFVCPATKRSFIFLTIQSLFHQFLLLAVKWLSLPSLGTSLGKTHLVCGMWFLSAHVYSKKYTLESITERLLAWGRVLESIFCPFKKARFCLRKQKLGLP